MRAALSALFDALLGIPDLRAGYEALAGAAGVGAVPFSDVAGCAAAVEAHSATVAPPADATVATVAGRLTAARLCRVAHGLAAIGRAMAEHRAMAAHSGCDADSLYKLMAAVSCLARVPAPFNKATGATAYKWAKEAWAGDKLPKRL